MIKDGVILIIICVFVGAGFLVWKQSQVPVHSLRPSDSQVLPPEPAPKPAHKVAKASARVSPNEFQPSEPQEAGKPVEEITGFDPTTVAVATPRPAASPVRREPPPFPVVDQIGTGVREDFITGKYGDPTVSTVTSTGGHMVETMVYARERGRSATVIRIEDGKVAAVYSQTQPVAPPGLSAPRHWHNE